ncbi:MAG TPA: hypothetical protein DCZ40_04120 [Lachnospiraceae bacterium]|nr:hypothetical protein [Lachnospiraceae bacterium]
MDEGKILYFYLKKGDSYKKHRWSKGRIAAAETDMGKDGKLGCCGVPEFYLKKRGWEENRLTEELSSIIKKEKAKDYYLQPQLAHMAGIEERLPPEVLLEKLLCQVPCLEYLIYIGWEGGQIEGALDEEQFREERQMMLYLLEPYLARINHFILVTDHWDGYEEFTEYIYEEYGIPASGVPELERQYGKNGKTVILDARKSYKIPCEQMPQRAAYVDFWSVEEKWEQIEGMRRDVKYISAVKFLDTLVKNGYNTIGN